MQVRVRSEGELSAEHGEMSVGDRSCCERSVDQLMLSCLVAVANDFDRHDAAADGIDGEPGPQRDGSAATVPEPDRLEAWERVEALATRIVANTALDDAKLVHCFNKVSFSCSLEPLAQREADLVP